MPGTEFPGGVGELQSEGIMKRKMGLLVGVVVTLVAAGLVQSAAAQVRVGTVDVQRVRKENAAFKAALKDIDEMSAGFEKKRDSQRAALDSLGQELQQASDRNLAATVDRLRREMTEKSQDFQKFMDETFGNQGIIDSHSSELLTPLYNNLADAAKTVAKAKGLDLVLDLEQINPLFASDTLDVTDAVLAELAKMR